MGRGGLQGWVELKGERTSHQWEQEGWAKPAKCTVSPGHPHPLLNGPSREAFLSSCNHYLLSTYYMLGQCKVLRLQQPQVAQLMDLCLRAGGRQQ